MAAEASRLVPFPAVPVFRFPDPTPTLAAAWEAFVADCEQHMDLGVLCPWCEGEPDTAGVLAHTADCAFQIMDAAMARYRADLLQREGRY